MGNAFGERYSRVAKAQSLPSTIDPVNRFLVFAVATLLSCGRADHFTELKDFLRERQMIQDGELPQVIIYISEKGCPVCGREFTEKVRPFVSAPGTLTIVNATGGSIDLTGLLYETATIRHDDKGEFEALGLLKNSGLIFLSEDRIDTVMPLRINEPLDAMEARLRRTLGNP